MNSFNMPVGLAFEVMDFNLTKDQQIAKIKEEIAELQAELERETLCMTDTMQEAMDVMQAVINLHRILTRGEEMIDNVSTLLFCHYANEIHMKKMKRYREKYKGVLK